MKKYNPKHNNKNKIEIGGTYVKEEKKLLNGIQEMERGEKIGKYDDEKMNLDQQEKRFGEERLRIEKAEEELNTGK